jgi:hypothetical protein
MAAAGFFNLAGLKREGVKLCQHPLTAPQMAGDLSLVAFVDLRVPPVPAVEFGEFLQQLDSLGEIADQGRTRLGRHRQPAPTTMTSKTETVPPHPGGSQRHGQIVGALRPRRFRHRDAMGIGYVLEPHLIGRVGEHKRVGEPTHGGCHTVNGEQRVERGTPIAPGARSIATPDYEPPSRPDVHAVKWYLMTSFVFPLGIRADPAPVFSDLKKCSAR